MLLLFSGAARMWKLVGAGAVGALLLAVLQAVHRKIVEVAWAVSGIPILAVVGIVGVDETGAARLRGGLVVIVRFGVEEDAAMPRVSIGTLQVVSRNSCLRTHL